MKGFKRKGEEKGASLELFLKVEYLNSCFWYAHSIFSYLSIRSCWKFLWGVNVTLSLFLELYASWFACWKWCCMTSLKVFLCAEKSLCLCLNTCMHAFLEKVSYVDITWWRIMLKNPCSRLRPIMLSSCLIRTFMVIISYLMSNCSYARDGDNASFDLLDNIHIV